MSPKVKKFENRPTFIKVINEYQVARFYGPRCRCSVFENRQWNRLKYLKWPSKNTEGHRQCQLSTDRLGVIAVNGKVGSSYFRQTRDLAWSTKYAADVHLVVQIHIHRGPKERHLFSFHCGFYKRWPTNFYNIWHTVYRISLKRLTVPFSCWTT